MKSFYFVLFAIIAVSCQSQKENSARQIANYVTHIFQDSKGNLWFGTIDFGVAKFEGEELNYLTRANGLTSNRVVATVEDRLGNIWFGTGDGLSKYDGDTIINYSLEKGLCSNSVSQLFLDSKENFWIGTWGGVCRFKEGQFSEFNLPYPEVNTLINPDTKDWVTDIKEDSQGRIWFGRDGYGACYWDGKELTHVLKRDGLYSNNIIDIEFDTTGNIWFSTRVAERDIIDSNQSGGQGGIVKMTSKGPVYFPLIDGLTNSDCYEVFKDSQNNIWIGTVENGVYRYDGKEFKNYDVPISIMAMTEDKKGNIWMGGAGGLYRIGPNETIHNITQNGPWK